MMATTSSAIAKTYYRRSSLPPPNRIQYSPLQSSLNTTYIPSLDNNRRYQRTFCIDSRRYQPKTTFYDSRGLSLVDKTKNCNDIDNKTKENEQLSKELKRNVEVNKTFDEDKTSKISRSGSKSRYERDFSYPTKDR